jgi:hypothetical protein
LRLWCEEENILSSIYTFSHVDASDNQGPADSFCSIFHSFVSTLRAAKKSSSTISSAPNESGCLTWPILTQQDLSLLKSTAEYLCDTENNLVTWFPQYVCALVALNCSDGEDTIRLSDDVPLILVGQDNWSFEIHRCV